MKACRIKIYGERHTNTNYLSKLIQLNIEVEEIPGVIPAPVMILQWLVPGDEWIRDLYFKYGGGASLGWKHAMLSESLMSQIRRAESDGIRFITLTKNPYAWLLSLYRKPYHQDSKKTLDFVEFLKMPWRTVGRENCGSCVDSPIDLWNKKNRSYLGLPPSSSLRLTAEALLDNPAAIISQIANRFSLPMQQAEFINHDECTKSTGKTTGDYRDYYLGEVWREELSDDAVLIINQGLDLELMSLYGYKLIE